MSSTALKIGALVTVLLAVVLAALGFQVARQYAQQAESSAAASQQEPAEPQTLAVVAVQPLGAYRNITAEDVALVPVHTLPDNYYTTPEEVIGRSPLVDIDVGAPVTPRYFSEGNVLARQVAEGFKAVSIEVDDVIAVGGFVRPGDVVDVLLYVRGGGALGAPQSRVLHEGLRVLAFDDRIVDRPEGLSDNPAENRRRRQRTVVLAVPGDDTTRLMLGSNLGDLTLALHGQRTASSDDSEASGLPLAEEAKQAREAAKVPDLAVTAQQILKVEKPPSEAKKKPKPKPKVTVHRGGAVEDVSP